MANREKKEKKVRKKTNAGRERRQEEERNGVRKKWNQWREKKVMRPEEWEEE